MANFTTEYYPITVTASPSAGGTVSGGGTFAYGSSRTVTATANTGHTFANWTESGSVVSTSLTYQFTVNSNRDLVANFTPVMPAISGYVRTSGGMGISGVTMSGRDGREAAPMI